MIETIESDLEKLKKSLYQSDKILAFNTELRAIHIDSNSKIVELIYPSNSSPKTRNPSYLLRSKPVELVLKSSLFVSKVEITTFAPKNICMHYTDTLGKVHTQMSTSFRKDEVKGGHKVVLTINTPITKFSLSTVEGEVTLNRVKCFIYNESTVPSNSSVALSNHLDRLHVIQDRADRIAKLLGDENRKLEQQFSDLEDKENDLVAKEESLSESIEDKTTEIETLDNEIRVNDIALQDIRSNLSDATATLNLTREEVDSLDQSQSTFSEELTKLKAEVRSENSNLKQLKRDVDVFSEDLKAYTGETRKQQVFYGTICVVLLSVLVFITHSLFERSGELITTFDAGKITSIWDVVVSRIPFMLSIIGIVTFIAEGMRRCINQVVSLHDQRLTFLRLSIVAREVVTASVENEDLDPDEIVKLRIKLKLAMLRQHMEKDLGSELLDFEKDKNNVVKIKSSEDSDAA